ncbi:histidine kinase [Rhodospirillum rubrum]|uniref:FIST N-terminal domain-containing protein n=1 Tax=Rhodospirillum rubrum TaxID=1085 RepID=UPI0019090499|nr:FIST N-terminal domain-containing protein [Rhodospirillum rubrum]MBK1664000.1 histidine kinase [Rhodospirillum rubrum]MBK1675442.1 histidine kinase [Rhodospirillum rubrum]
MARATQDKTLVASPAPASLPDDRVVRVREVGPDLAGLDEASFGFSGRPAALALVFVSPHLDFAEVLDSLRRLAGPTPLIGVSSFGGLCASCPGGGLYRPAGAEAPGIILQVFSASLIGAVSIQAVSLHNADIRGGQPTLARDERVARIGADLAAIALPFALDARDSLALTFVDGLSACENYLMEAIYESARFPCLFVGGSAAGTLEFRHTYLFDGQRVLEDHAVLVFVKLAPGKRYGILKSQNFVKSGVAFSVVEADADRRTVTSVLDETTGAVRPIIEVLAETLGTTPEGVGDALIGHTFGIEVSKELFVRSVSRIDLAAGTVSFFCDVNRGDRLELLDATDFVEQTRRDVTDFLRDKPPPLGVLLNDCILRRLNNEPALAGLNGLWLTQTAGFSTFGELLGININQTLTAVAFFDDPDGGFHDPFVDGFPLHYASYCSYFTLTRLHRLESVARLRADMSNRLIHHLGASPDLAALIEGMVDSSPDVGAMLSGVRAAIARDLAAEERVRQAERQLKEAIETINDGFAFYDAADRLVICNAQYHTTFAGAEDAIEPGNTFGDIVRGIAARGVFCHEGADLERFVAEMLAEHQAPTGRGQLHRVRDGHWIVSKEFRMPGGGVVATRTDVSELKRREEEVEALKRRYELILRSAGDGIVGIDWDETITFANQAAGAMLGRPAETLIGCPYRQVLSGGAEADLLPAFPLLGETGLTGEGVFLRDGGADFIAEFMLAPIRETATFEGAVLVFRDISLRKHYEAGIVDQQRQLEEEVAERTFKLSAEISMRARVENVLRDSQGRMRAIAASLFEGVLLIDAHGIIVFANKSAYRWLETVDLVDHELDEVLKLRGPGRLIDFAESPFRRVIDSGETLIDDDAAFVVGAGHVVSVAYAASPLEEGGKRRIAVLSFRSIDALKEAQREALQASRLASVGQLAAGIAHEINTPIQYVGDNLRFIEGALGELGGALADLRTLAARGGLEAEADGCFAAKDIAYLMEELPLAATQSLQGVDHVAHIVRSMKEFSHPGTTAKVATDINRAIDSTLTVSRNEWKQLAQVETDLDADLPMILCFAAEINQVLLNLIVNAAHAIESVRAEGQLGTIHIATRGEAECIEIRITDSGPGVPLAIRDKIFDPFFTTKSVGKGTGQGLSICRDVVVTKHGGKMHLDTSVSPGACFVVRLPIGSAE